MSSEDDRDRDAPGLWVQVQTFSEGGQVVDFDKPHRIHINAGTHKFTLRITPEGLRVSTRTGSLEIRPQSTNLILVREVD